MTHRIGQFITARFRPASGDTDKTGHVVSVDPLQVYFGPWTGTVTFGPDGFEKPARRWGAYIVETSSES